MQLLIQINPPMETRTFLIVILDSVMRERLGRRQACRGSCRARPIQTPRKGNLTISVAMLCFAAGVGTACEGGAASGHTAVLGTSHRKGNCQCFHSIVDSFANKVSLLNRIVSQKSKEAVPCLSCGTLLANLRMYFYSQLKAWIM